ncbi:MAG TPA: DUF6265 family protein [Vicinamibacteria bacterium]
MNARVGLVVACLAVSFLAESRPAATASPTDIAAVAWMAGSWQGSDGGMEMEEIWLAPKGGAMLGLHRDVAKGRMVSFEFLRIEADKEGLVYLASPLGKPATPFRLVESAKTRAVFANPAHDFPQRILYWLADDGRLHAKIEGSQGGKPASQEWSWSRVK